MTRLLGLPLKLTADYNTVNHSVLLLYDSNTAVLMRNWWSMIPEEYEDDSETLLLVMSMNVLLVSFIPYDCVYCHKMHLSSSLHVIIPATRDSTLHAPLKLGILLY